MKIGCNRTWKQVAGAPVCQNPPVFQFFAQHRGYSYFDKRRQVVENRIWFEKRAGDKSNKDLEKKEQDKKERVITIKSSER